MTARKAVTRSSTFRQNRGERLKDEVYRQMFRLEAGRPGAELALTIALLRGWLAADCEPEVSKSREWLKKICPVCLLMIEARQQANNSDQRVSSKRIVVPVVQ
jgi:hypothetical protein